VWRDDISPLDAVILQGLGDGLAGSDRPCMLDRMIALAIVVAYVAIDGCRVDHDMHVWIRHRIRPMADSHAVDRRCSMCQVDAYTYYHADQEATGE